MAWLRNYYYLSLVLEAVFQSLTAQHTKRRPSPCFPAMYCSENIQVDRTQVTKWLHERTFWFAEGFHGKEVLFDP